MNNENKILELLISLNKGLKEVNERLDRIEHIQEFHSAELEGLKFTNAEMQGDIKNVQSKLENMDINIKEIQLNLTVLERRQYHVEKDMASLELKIS